MLLAVVSLKSESPGRHYRLATERDYAAVFAAQQAVRRLPRGAVPNEPTPIGGGSGAGRAFSVQKYGIKAFSDLFSDRQNLVLSTLAKAIHDVAGRTPHAIVRLLGLCLGKTADLGNAGAPWERDAECPVNLLGSQRIRPLWDWCETVVTSEASGSFFSSFQRSAATIALAFNYRYEPGSSTAADATEEILPRESADVWFTDPPYYDAIPYADLSDFFFVWLKRALPELLPHDASDSNALTPKDREIVQDEARVFNGVAKDRTFFEDMMAKAFSRGRHLLKGNGIGSVVFAHKTTEGWEALLSGMIRGGWVVSGSWPLATEMAHRPRARDSAALATSVHLICRPRDEERIGDWGEVLRELPKRVGDWMERLQGEGVRGADLVFACIGPALEIFSRYSKVETAEGREVHLPEYLAKVWEVVGRTALEHVLGTAEAKARNGAAGALEEDARLSALFLWTVQSTDSESDAAEQPEDENEDESESSAGKKKKGAKLIFDVVRRFAQPLGIRLPDWEGRIIETEKGVVRLLPVRERSIQLFGEDGARGAASEIERGSDTQLVLFPDARETIAPRVRGRRRATHATEPAQREATTLDRVHAAMLLQASGQANALRAMLEAEQERSPDFLRLANALSALYPKESEEKRLLDAMLLAVPK